MLKFVTPGHKAPDEVNVVIEIPANSEAVKYEVDKDSSAMFVDRFMATSMRYPCDYGYIPQTLGDDGDPIDVLVIAPLPLISGSVITVRPVGMLKMTDEAGLDTKILAVPISKLTPIYHNVQEPIDIGEFVLDKIAHFFEHYKDLEPNKWVKIEGWRTAAEARAEIVSGLQRYKNGK